MTEPPEAGFLVMEAAVTLSKLDLRHQSYLDPRSLEPMIPSSAGPMGDALMALEAMLAAVEPAARRARRFSFVTRDGLAYPKCPTPELEVPVCCPTWPDSLGLTFTVAGIENIFGEGSATETVSFSEVSDAVAHSSIPGRRAARQVPNPPAFELGTEHLLPAPTVSAPRLRIHLPKPVLNPFRPRYAFAPRPAAPAEEPMTVEATSVRTEEMPSIEKQPDLAVIQERISAVPEDGGKVRSNRPNRAIVDLKARRASKNDAAVRAATPETKQRATAQPEMGNAAVAVNKTEQSAKSRLVEKTEPAATPLPSDVEKTVVSEPARTYAVPSFSGNTDAAPEGFWAKMPGWQKAVAAVLLIGVAIGGAVGAGIVPTPGRSSSAAMSLPSPAASATASVGVDSWSTERAADTSGIARHRVISRYKPAATKRDLIFEFTGQIETRSLGWVFRMKDVRNYYCLKLELSGAGPSEAIQLVKFAVINGEEQPHRLVPLRETFKAGSPIKVRLDVRGQNFSTQVNGKHVDVWIDNQLADGTVGFSNETGERAVIRTVKVSF